MCPNGPEGGETADFNMSSDIDSISIEEISTETICTIEVPITAADVDKFAALTGDINPLHMDTEFARARGFRERVAHGALLAGHVSRIFGTRLPGEDCLLQSLNLTFSAPAYVGDMVTITASVFQVSRAMSSFAARVEISNTATGELLARGKAQIGFTGKSAL